jgi:hypothetical protein
VGVDLSVDLDADCAPEVLFAHVADLGAYPAWLGIVDNAVPHPGLDLTLGVDGDGDADPGAWLVELRGRLGPVARSKRLRMVRTMFDPPWVLDARVEQRDGSARLTVDLHYGGSFGGALLERMLSDEIEQSRPRLAALVAGPAPA